MGRPVYISVPNQHKVEETIKVSHSLSTFPVKGKEVMEKNIFICIFFSSFGYSENTHPNPYSPLS